MSRQMALCVATMRPKSGDCIGPGDISLATANAVTSLGIYVRYNNSKDNLGVVGSYQELYKRSNEEILCFMHDDVIVRERGWDERVLREFDDPGVGLVGFGGARWHGVPEMYKLPYQLQQLRRGDYLSNVDDAEVHGERFTGACDVAVLDGYALIARRALLDRMGGWQAIAGGCDFFCYDYALCAHARRLGYRIRCVGVRCHHRGGQSSTKAGVEKMVGQEQYEKSHKWFYENFRDVMPAKVRV